MKKHKSILILLVILLLFLLSACAPAEEVTEDPLADIPYEVRKDWHSTITGRKTPVHEFDTEPPYVIEKTIDGYSLGIGCWGTITPEEMLEECEIMVRGTVVGFDYTAIRDYENGISDGNKYLNTDYFVLVTEILRGDPIIEENGFMRVRRGGGEGVDRIDLEAGPYMEVGVEYVFALRAHEVEKHGEYPNYDIYYEIVHGNYGMLTKTPTTAEQRVYAKGPWDIFFSFDFSNRDGCYEYSDIVEMVEKYSAE